MIAMGAVLAFYRDTLGFEVGLDVGAGKMRRYRSGRDSAGNMTKIRELR